MIWSDDRTEVAGTILATGVGLSGNGGDAEVSGRARLSCTGFADLSSAHGAFGTLLLDSYNVTISNGADTGGFTASGNNSVINRGTIIQATLLSCAHKLIRNSDANPSELRTLHFGRRRFRAAYLPPAP